MVAIECMVFGSSGKLVIARSFQRGGRYRPLRQVSHSIVVEHALPPEIEVRPTVVEQVASTVQATTASGSERGERGCRAIGDRAMLMGGAGTSPRGRVLLVGWIVDAWRPDADAKDGI